MGGHGSHLENAAVIRRIRKLRPIKNFMFKYTGLLLENKQLLPKEESKIPNRQKIAVLTD
jgi:hypothetical protein